MSSPYMEWAKTRSGARYPLSYSGVASFPLSGLPVSIEDLELSGAAGYGYPPLLQALAEKFGVGPERVVTAAGTSMANHLAMAALLESGDELLIEHPTYELITSTARFLGAQIRTFNRRFEDGFQIDPDEVRKNVTPRTRMIVVTNLHNPSSVLTPDEILKQIGEIALDCGAMVLVDEVYLEAMFEKAPKTAALLGDQFLVTSSLTKAYGLSGLRCGWILANREVVRKIWRMNDLFSANGAHAAELLSVIALKNLDRVIAKSKALLDANRAAMNEFFALNLVDVVVPEFGTTAFPRLRTGSVDRLAGLLREKYETTIVPGSFFGMDQHFRVGIGAEPDAVKKGFNRLAQAIKELNYA